MKNLFAIFLLCAFVMNGAVDAVKCYIGDFGNMDTKDDCPQDKTFEIDKCYKQGSGE